MTPAGAATVETRELDFQLGANQGISVEGVLGYGIAHDDSPAVSDTVPAFTIGTQTLHLETGAIESIPTLAGEEADDIDTEIFYVQQFTQIFQVPSTAGGGGGSMHVTPSGLVTFSKPIETARNISHSGLSRAAGQNCEMGVLIYYRYVLFSNAEIGFLLARRQ